MMIDAVVRELQIIGEATKRLSSAFKNSKPEIPWDKIAGMRDKIIHDYVDINNKIVWAVIQEDLPELKKVLREDLETEK